MSCCKKDEKSDIQSLVTQYHCKMMLTYFLMIFCYLWWWRSRLLLSHHFQHVCKYDNAHTLKKKKMMMAVIFLMFFFWLFYYYCNTLKHVHSKTCLMIYYAVLSCDMIRPIITMQQCVVLLKQHHCSFVCLLTHALITGFAYYLLLPSWPCCLLQIVLTIVR